jgi:L-fuculose-phosphate aldolase
MDFLLLPPRDQIVMLMQRIYGYGMTTTSGGNLSILDDDGAIWITPASVDKGRLRREDIARVRPDGTIEGPHRPSSEFPFHKAIYARRPDVRAILHAHPPALVAFSIVRQVPDTRIIPQARHICGEVGCATYGLPGSEELGRNIADTFAKGHDTVLLENHGIVTSGKDLFQAFRRFETLDFCARLTIHARRLGAPRVLTQEQLDLFERKRSLQESFPPDGHSSLEKELRQVLCDLLHRAYDQQLVTSTEGTFSVRLDAHSFLITPYNQDRKYIEPADLVRVGEGGAEAGKTPSRSAELHRRIYREHPGIGAIIIAHPPHAMAFGVVDVRFNSRTIPESYIVLRGVPSVAYGTQFMDTARLSAILAPAVPVVLLENDCLITTGANLAQAYDRLEVAEFTAKALIEAQPLGSVVLINADQVRALEALVGG